MLITIIVYHCSAVHTAAVNIVNQKMFWKDIMKFQKEMIKDEDQ